MNSEEVKAAKDRLRRVNAGEWKPDVYGTQEPKAASRQYVDDLLITSDAYIAAPQWRDRPTCAGLWYFPHRNRCRIVLAGEVDWTSHANSCFGPIPERPAT